jgi:hypothetical protein
MSRTSVSSPHSPRRGNFRPHLEALEDRLAPGALPWGQTAQERVAADVAALVSASGAIQTTRPVVDFATGSIVFGESTVTRTAQGITAHLTASGLRPGVYTFWTRVDALDGSMVSGRLAGHVVGQDGKLNFSAHVSAGEVLGAGTNVNPHFPSGPLQDPLHSTINLVVRYHGPADPGRIHEQTHTFEATNAFNILLSIHAPPPP